MIKLFRLVQARSRRLAAVTRSVHRFVCELSFVVNARFASKIDLLAGFARRSSA
jgi:hypothetical protein